MLGDSRLRVTVIAGAAAGRALGAVFGRLWPLGVVSAACHEGAGRRLMPAR